MISGIYHLYSIAVMWNFIQTSSALLVPQHLVRNTTMKMLLLLPIQSFLSCTVYLHFPILKHCLLLHKCSFSALTVQVDVPASCHC